MNRTVIDKFYQAKNDDSYDRINIKHKKEKFKKLFKSSLKI